MSRDILKWIFDGVYGKRSDINPGGRVAFTEFPEKTYTNTPLKKVLGAPINSNLAREPPPRPITSLICGQVTKHCYCRGDSENPEELNDVRGIM